MSLDLSKGSERRLFRTRRGVLTAAVSVAAHAFVGFVLIAMQPARPIMAEPKVMTMMLTELPPPQAPAPPPPEAPKPAEPPPQQKIVVRPTPLPPPPDVKPLMVKAAPKAAVAVNASEVGDGELAGAATAGSGPSGGGCNMPHLLQTALRKDPLVRAAVARANRGKAIRVWNGSWVRHSEEEGEGLAAVREAIMWEVGFSPAACRAQPVKGLVLLSLDDSPGGARIVVGSNHWRWSDMLFARQGASNVTLSER